MSADLQGSLSWACIHLGDAYDHCMETSDVAFFRQRAEMLYECRLAGVPELGLHPSR